MKKEDLKSFLKKYFIWEAAIFAAVLILDLVTKKIAQNTLDGYASVPVVGNLVRFTFVENFGASYGMLSSVPNKNVLFFLMTLFGIGFFSVLFYLARKKSLLQRIGISLMTAGAIGNAIDRLIQPDQNGLHTFFSGGVRDFIAIDFGIDPLRFVCNVADIALSAGLVIFAIMFVFFDKETKADESEKN